MEKFHSIISNEQIRALLPQKSPFVMVSHLLSYTDNSIISGFEIKPENLFLENNYFNEAGMIENIAQTFALHNGYSYFLKDESAPVGYIGTIKKVEFFDAPLLGENIETKVQIIQKYMNVTLIEGEIKQGKKKLMELSMKTFLAE